MRMRRWARYFARRDAERGQIMPIFAAAIVVLLLFASLLIDGSLMLQSQLDLNTIARHSAAMGAQKIDWDSYNSECTQAYRKEKGSCHELVVLNGESETTAAAIAASWVEESDKTTIRLPTTGEATINAARGDKNRTLTVTIGRCYSPFFFGMLGDILGSCGGIMLNGSSTSEANSGW